MHFVNFCCNDVTPSNIMEMKTDVTKQFKMMSRLSPCSDLLQNNSWQFSIASLGTLC